MCGYGGSASYRGTSPSNQAAGVAAKSGSALCPLAFGNFKTQSPKAVPTIIVRDSMLLPDASVWGGDIMLNAMSREEIMARMKDGFGRGEGISYEPWLKVRDVPSLGKTRRVPGQKTGREHVVFSNGEFDAFVILQRHPAVRDIREQWPLSTDDTLAIANELGVRHPLDRGNTAQFDPKQPSGDLN